jgi:hypothetical protein
MQKSKGKRQNLCLGECVGKIFLVAANAGFADVGNAYRTEAGVSALVFNGFTTVSNFGRTAVFRNVPRFPVQNHYRVIFIHP